MGYALKEGSALDGKYGMALRLNFSHAHSPAADASFWKWGRTMYYQDLNLQTGKRLSPSVKLNLLYMNQFYNQTAFEGKDGMVHNDIFVAETQCQLGNRFALRGETQYLVSDQQVNDEVFCLMELSVGEHWTFTLGDEYFPLDGHMHYRLGSFTFAAGGHSLHIDYGRISAGYNCTDGICRYVPQARGLMVSCAYEF